MIMLAAVLITRLSYVQIGHEAAANSDAGTTYTRTYNEVASRGEIFDRNGVPLVSNLMGFTIELDYYEWDLSRQNETLLTLCEILQSAEIIYNDNLPISQRVPFVYTYETPYGASAKQLAAFVAEQTDWPENPTAPELFSLLCDKYDVDRNLGLYQKRAIVGMRYYLEDCQFSAYNNPVSIAKDVDIDTVAKISELSLFLPGVEIQVDDVRQIETTLAAHILGRYSIISPEEYKTGKDEGYLLTDSIGKDGMERALESYLRGIDGQRNVEVSSQTGEIVREYYAETPIPGNHCYLTLDMGLQAVAEQALADTIATVKANGERSYNKKGADIEGGALVVLHIKTGEVLAMASYPTFDLSRYSQDFNDLMQNPLLPTLNRAINGVYPPGSTFKMVTAVAALESGTVTTTDKIKDEGVYRFYETYQPRCWLYNQNGGTHGNINISDALKYSCNYFFYEVGRIMGIEVLNEYGTALGLGQKTGIELGPESAGLLDGPEYRVGTNSPWQPGNVLAAAIGQAGHQLTPIQLANYMATILNGGERYRPHLLKYVTNYTGDNVLETTKPEITNVMSISDTTVNAIKAGMLGVVTEDGTASSYFRDFSRYAGFEVGGKTGSAETKSGRSAHGVFLSFAPYDDPEIVVVVIGEYAGTGGSMSPACIEIYNHYFNLSTEIPAADNTETRSNSGGSGSGNASTGSSTGGTSIAEEETPLSNEPDVADNGEDEPPGTDDMNIGDADTALPEESAPPEESVPPVEETPTQNETPPVTEVPETHGDADPSIAEG